MKQSNTISFSALIGSLVLLCLSLTFKAQLPVNPSFEGMSGIAITPQGWQAHGKASSPDTQPGAWHVTTEASHGYSYISMVCRGFSIYDSYLHEGIAQTLQTPLWANQTYHYSIDLAYSAKFKADTIRFNQPAKLRVLGLNEMNQQEVLYESEAVSNSQWKTFFFDLTPGKRTTKLVLEAYYVKMPKYCGNLLLDNMQYYETLPIKKDIIVNQEQKDTIQNDVVQLNEIGLPDTIDGRVVNQNKEILMRGKKLTVTIWDHRTQDGDVVSLFLNGEEILEKYMIGKTRLDLTIDVEENQDYFLTLYAHNLGDIPPNTVALYVSDGVRKKFLTLSSDLDRCEAVKLKIEAPLTGFKQH